MAQDEEAQSIPWCEGPLSLTIILKKNRELFWQTLQAALERFSTIETRQDSCVTRFTIPMVVTHRTGFLIHLLGAIVSKNGQKIKELE